MGVSVLCNNLIHCVNRDPNRDTQWCPEFTIKISYSGKFLWVQNFVESPLRALEKIFAVLIFVVPVRTGRQGAIDIALAAIFAVFIFAKADLSAKTAKFCTRRKFPPIR